MKLIIEKAPDRGASNQFDVWFNDGENVWVADGLTQDEALWMCSEYLRGMRGSYLRKQVPREAF